MPLTQLRLHSEPYSPSGNMAASGVAKLLGAPRLDLLQTVVREAVQNCCDAAKRGVGPRVTFRLRRLSSDQRHALATYVLAELPDHAETAEPIRSYVDGETCWVLEICDFATTGLEGPTRADLLHSDTERKDFVNFMRDIGTPRDTVQGGGTYGFGKSALYLASRCRLILVDTETTCGGEPVRRLIGAKLGEPHYTTTNGRERRFTGRHWWGVTEDREGFADPLEGEDAVHLAAELGFPDRDRDRTGTSIMIVDPQFVDDNIADVIGAIQESLLWNFWPRMMADVAPERRLDLTIELDGVDQPIPRPEDIAPISLFCDALRGIRNGLPSVQSIDGERPIVHLGRLNIVKDLRGERVPLRNDGETLFPSPCHHIAVMRPVELVVRYYNDGDPLPQGDLEWAGVFVASSNDEVERAFAAAEPPAHDDWQPDMLPKRSREKSFVRIALKRIRGAAQAVAGGRIELTGGQVAAPSLGQVADLFGRALGSANGQGAGPRERGTGSGGGSRKGWSISRPAFVQLQEQDGEPVAVFRADVRNEGRVELLLELEPAIVIDGGSAASDAGSEGQPQVIAVQTDDGIIGASNGVYRIGSYAGLLLVAIALPYDGAVTLKAKITPEAGA